MVFKGIKVAGTICEAYTT